MGNTAYIHMSVYGSSDDVMPWGSDMGSTLPHMEGCTSFSREEGCVKFATELARQERLKYGPTLTHRAMTGSDPIVCWQLPES